MSQLQAQVSGSSVMQYRPCAYLLVSLSGRHSIVLRMTSPPGRSMCRHSSQRQKLELQLHIVFAILILFVFCTDMASLLLFF